MNYRSNSEDRRKKLRRSAMSGHTVEFLLPGAPIYQLKAKDISETGIGVIVRPDSKFLNMIQAGQEMNVKLHTLQESSPNQGIYKARISHITALDDGRFKGHKLVALELMSKIS